ncbi:uncharacterized protein [Mytilus edulis]|uniref:uncharacterized protein n=1 Tax=Mytilus edulis TaxID=6550 RepID=UPI0039F121F5
MATASISSVQHVSEEEENYLRMHLLLTGISPRAVRVLFDKEFHPSLLNETIKKEYSKLYDLKIKRVINAAQWTLLFPRGGTPTSKTFDVTLMVALLRNLTNLPEPAGGYDQLPTKSDTTLTADLARIKHYRNQLSHFGGGQLESELFSTAWQDLTGAIERLGGPNMHEECNDLRTKHLDQSTIPWNIRAQMSQILDQWQKNDGNFVKTRAAKQVLECVQRNRCVTITASAGVGKTATLRHVVLKMADEGYQILMVTNPHDIFSFCNPNKKTLFVIDDFCGTYSINQADLNSWEPVIKRVEELIQNKLIKLIVACRLQVFKDRRFESLSIFRANVCNLLSEEMSLLQTEKESIAQLYLNTKSTEIIKYCNLYECFPLLCKLYHDNTQLNITDFFQNPFSVYEAEMEELVKKSLFGKYCALALCVLFNNSLSENVLTEEIHLFTKTIIENTCEACRLDKGTSRLTLLDELNSLEHTFIKKEQGVYKIVHAKLFDFLSYYFGKKIIQCLIRNASSYFIMERFILEKEDILDQFIIIVPPRYHKLFIYRMIFDWSNGEIIPVFCNKNMSIPTFRQRLLRYLNILDKSFQIQLAQTFEVFHMGTPLLHCSFIGDIHLIQWCLCCKADINLCTVDGQCPLFLAASEGHTKAVKMLLDNNADINKCTDDDTFPLYIACQKGYTDIVKVLLDNKADLNNLVFEGASPLYAACLQGHTDIVKVLLDNKADINKCGNKGASPLFAACVQNDNVDTVKLLLDRKAEINKCTVNEISPLFMACQNGFTNIVKVFLDNKADINKCMDNETSPFCIACQNGNNDIVKMLLDNKADINKCGINGSSPLFCASLNNHVDTVKMLLDNKVDINNCTDNDELFPLLMACQNGYKDMVKLLLENKADINQRGQKGTTSLIMACQEGYLDIVKLLLDNKADINMCGYKGSTPLLIACQEGHIDIVRLLLDNNADINKRADNGASIFLLLVLKTMRI